MIGIIWWAAFALAGDLYVQTLPDGSVMLTDSPRGKSGYTLWWDDPDEPSGKGGMTRLDSISNLDAYDAHIRDASAATGVPAELIKAVAVVESRMNPRAVSRAGAKGLMQLMPGTADALGVSDPFDPADCILGGARYLAKQKSAFSTWEKALAAYNAGPETVRKAGGIPPIAETQRYVSSVLGLYRHFRDTRPVGQ